MAFVIAPEAPLPLWLDGLDAQMHRSPGFFEARPVIVDFAALNPNDPGTNTPMMCQAPPPGAADSWAGGLPGLQICRQNRCRHQKQTTNHHRSPRS